MFSQEDQNLLKIVSLLGNKAPVHPPPAEPPPDQPGQQGDKFECS